MTASRVGDKLRITQSELLRLGACRNDMLDSGSMILFEDKVSSILEASSLSEWRKLFYAPLAISIGKSLS